MLIIRCLRIIAAQGVRANRSEVSRQTVYNWRDRGLLVFDAKKKIDVPATVALWRFLSKLR